MIVGKVPEMSIDVLALTCINIKIAVGILNEIGRILSLESDVSDVHLCYGDLHIIMCLLLLH